MYDLTRRSLLTGSAAVAAALRAGGHCVFEFDPARDDVSTIDWRRLPVGRPADRRTVAIDCVFIALHGTFGEDGQVQAILDAHDIPYTGSDAEASAVAFSKWDAKQRFLIHGVPTPQAVRITATDSPGVADCAASAIGYPLVVKPDKQGSSIGVTIVPSAAHLEAALSNCFRFDSSGIIEAAVLGEEWTVAVIDGEALPPIRIGTSRQFYDYTAKYAADDTQYQFESDSHPLTGTLSGLGRAACQAVGAAGVARVDLRLDGEGNPHVLEVNTIPGMTDHSLVPKAAARAGMSMTNLCERAVVSAIRTHHAWKNSRVLRGPSSTHPHRRAG